MAVVLYHLGFAALPGGFVGVDVFFVISGYLITGIVSRKLQEGSFSLPDFFVRRIRRLFPAMFVVVCLTLVGGYFLLSPPDLAKLGASSVSAIFSFSNIYFWSGTGYFDTDAMTKPLLHTWSLGVEEQFYLFWPLLLIAIWKWFGGRFASVIAVVGVASFAACQFILPTSQETSFFWTPLRAYEFAVGGILAAINPRPTSKSITNILFVLGAVLITYPIAYFNHSTAFPGWSALIPCLGTALLILAAPHSSFKNIIGSKPAVWIGKCSYSIYLVHWPLIVLFSYYYLDAPELQHKLLLLAASVALGYALFAVVEQPFRNGTVAAKFKSGRTAIVSACTVVVAMSAISLNAWTSDGWAWRLPEDLRKSMDVVLQQRLDYWESAWKSHRKFQGDKPKVYVIGNSHAVDIYYAIKQNPNLDVVIDGTTTHRCYALNVALEPEFKEKCQSLLAQLAHTDNAKNADFIVINELYRVEQDNSTYIDSLKKSITIIREVNPTAKIIIFGPKATYNTPIYVKLLEYGRLRGADKYVTRYYTNSPQKIEAFDKLLSKLANENGWGYFSMYSSFCISGVCEVLTPDNKMIYWDNGHWTYAGASYLHKKLQDQQKYRELFNI